MSAEDPGDLQGTCKKVPSALQRVLSTSKLKEHAHWVALLGGMLPAMTASVISVMTAYRGEPQANRAYETLAPQLNAQKNALQIILMRLAQLEGHYEGQHAGMLVAKIDQLSHQNEELKQKLNDLTSTPVKKVEAPSQTAQTEAVCNEGEMAGADRKCHPVRKAIEAKVKAAEAQTVVVKKQLKEKQEWLTHEKEQRKLLEQKVRMLKKQAPSPSLKAVPENLPEK